jgi:hypothetical protein
MTDPFRDERAALRARVEQLEQINDELRSKIDQLKNPAGAPSLAYRVGALVRRRRRWLEAAVPLRTLLVHPAGFVPLCDGPMLNRPLLA